MTRINADENSSFPIRAHPRNPRSKEMKRWPTVPLGDLVTKKSGSVDPAKFPEEVFDLYSIPAFDTRQPEVRAGNESVLQNRLSKPMTFCSRGLFRTFVVHGSLEKTEAGD